MSAADASGLLSVPFSGSIIGSWLFTRSSRPAYTPRIIYHFTIGEQSYWEHDLEEKRILARVKYRFEGNVLTIVYSNGNERQFELALEEDGSVRVPSPNGDLWWMARLTKPEPYSKAFVDERGELQKLEGAA